MHSSWLSESFREPSALFSTSFARIFSIFANLSSRNCSRSSVDRFLFSWVILTTVCISVCTLPSARFLCSHLSHMYLSSVARGGQDKRCLGDGFGSLILTHLYTPNNSSTEATPQPYSVGTSSSVFPPPGSTRNLRVQFQAPP